MDRNRLVRPVSSINRYLGEPTSAVPADAVELVGDGLTVTESRPMGTVHLLDGLWRALGVDAALRRVLGSRRFSTDVERVLVALIANRAIDPMSKLSAAEWASCDVTIPGLPWNVWPPSWSGSRPIRDRATQTSTKTAGKNRGSRGGGAREGRVRAA